MLLLPTPDLVPAVETALVNLPAEPAIQSFDSDYETVSIEVNAPAPGIVWISDCFYPGWKATVNGIEKKLLRVNYTFRGVYVEKGQHKIQMLFKPDSLRVGLLLGVSGLLLLIFLLVWPNKKTLEQ